MTVDALRRGEAAVLDDLLAEHGQQIQDVAFLILRDRGDAEDVLADTLLAALDRAQTLRDPAALRSWLLRIAVNRALDHRRKRIRLVSLTVSHDRPVAGPDVAEHLAIMAALDDLPPRARAVIVLHYHADLPVADVAAVIGTSANTVKTQLKQALRRLRTSLKDEPSHGLAEEVARG